MRLIKWLAWQIYLLRHWPARLRMRRQMQHDPLPEPGVGKTLAAPALLSGPPPDPIPDRRWRLYPTDLSNEAVEDFLKYWDDPKKFKRVTEKLRKIFRGRESHSGSDQK